jgi:hypothetical protein
VSATADDRDFDLSKHTPDRLDLDNFIFYGIWFCLLHSKAAMSRQPIRLTEPTAKQKQLLSQLIGDIHDKSLSRGDGDPR